MVKSLTGKSLTEKSLMVKSLTGKSLTEKSNNVYTLNPRSSLATLRVVGVSLITSPLECWKGKVTLTSLTSDHNP